VPRHRAKEPQAVRCIALLVALVNARRGVHVRQFAERKGWNWRALYRDLDTLRDAGVPVEVRERGWFGVPGHWIPPGMVDVKHDELLALAIAPVLAPGLRNTSFGRALANLWTKLSSPGNQMTLPFGDPTWITARPLASIDYGRHRRVLDTVHDAIRQRRALNLHYRKLSGEESTRVIEPVSVRWDAVTEALYVVAWCRTRETSRMFAVHRIMAADLTNEPFVPRREVVTEMSKAYRLWPRSTTERVSLRFSPRVAAEIRERSWHATERKTDTADGGVVLEMDIAAPEEMERLLLGYGADVTIDEPARLAARVRERHAEAAGPARFGVLRAARRGKGDTKAAPRRRPRSKGSKG
jgi:predicted DNA-binding transcriptional regulator YafY